MSELKMLKSKIMVPGTKFVISEDTEDGSFGPGTTGVISYVKGHDQDFPNVYFLRAVIVRRGKGGKNRLEQADLSTPIFDTGKKGMSKVLPENKRKYFVRIEPEVLPCVRVEDLERYDFLGWAFATTLFLQKLAGHAKHYRVWPESGDHILNKMKLLDDYYTEDPDYVEESMTSQEIRREFLSILRPLQSTLALSTLIYMGRVSSLEKQAAEVLYHNHSKENFIAAKDSIAGAVKFSDYKKQRLIKLSEVKNRRESLAKEVMRNKDLI
jgi:hypothetical protein